MDLEDLVDPVDLEVLVDLLQGHRYQQEVLFQELLVVLVDQMDPVDLADQTALLDLVKLVDLVDLKDLGAQVVLEDQGVQVDLVDL